MFCSLPEGTHRTGYVGPITLRFTVSRDVYRDFDEFADALAGIEGRFIPTARSTSEWWLAAVSANSIGLQEFQIGSPSTFAGQGQAGTFTLAIPIHHRGLRVDGQVAAPDSFIAFCETQPLTFASGAATGWVSVSVPTNSTIVAPELIERHSQRGSRSCTDLSTLVRLQELIQRLMSAGESVNEPAAAKAAEQEIAVCIARFLDHSRGLDDSNALRPQLSRNRVISRCLALIETNLGQPLFIEDLCRAAQVSERTLRNIFYEYFGVGPMRLLRVRQLHEIRAALLRAGSSGDTVTRIASQHGVWDFSLFARNYKALFGEAPSRTLRTPPTALRNENRKLSWLELASRIFVDDTVLRLRHLASTDRAPQSNESGVSVDEPADEQAPTPLLPIVHVNPRASNKRR